MKIVQIEKILLLWLLMLLIFLREITFNPTNFPKKPFEDKYIRLLQDFSLTISKRIKLSLFAQESGDVEFLKEMKT